MINIVAKHEPREYSLISHNGGIVICDKMDGAFLLMRFPEDVERLRALLATIDVTRLPATATNSHE